jgi:hypothetical protein
VLTIRRPERVHFQKAFRQFPRYSAYSIEPLFSLTTRPTTARCFLHSPVSEGVTQHSVTPFPDEAQRLFYRLIYNV